MSELKPWWRSRPHCCSRVRWSPRPRPCPWTRPVSPDLGTASDKHGMFQLSCKSLEGIVYIRSTQYRPAHAHGFKVTWMVWMFDLVHSERSKCSMLHECIVTAVSITLRFNYPPVTSINLVTSITLCFNYPPVTSLTLHDDGHSLPIRTQNPSLIQIQHGFEPSSHAQNWEYL